MKPTLEQKIKLLIEKWDKHKEDTAKDIKDPATHYREIITLRAVLYERESFILDLEKLIENE